MNSQTGREQGEATISSVPEIDEFLSNSARPKEVGLCEFLLHFVSPRGVPLGGGEVTTKRKRVRACKRALKTYEIWKSIYTRTNAGELNCEAREN